MNYYYVPKEGIYKNKLIGSKDINKIEDDPNKIVVVGVDNDFHVLIEQNGEYDKEKKVFDYYGLVNFLIENKLNTYFFNVNDERLKNIVRDVKTKKQYESPKDYKKDEYIFAVHGDKVLKMSVKVRADVIKEAIIDAYKLEISEPRNCSDRVCLTDFVKTNLFRKYNLPFVQEDGKFVVPHVYSSFSSLFCELNDIYSRKDSNGYIELTNQDLYLINDEYPEVEEYSYASDYAEAYDEFKIKEKIVDNLEAEVKTEYDYKEFENALSFMETYQRNEWAYDILKLKKIKNVLQAAKDNEELVNNMCIIKDDIKPVLKKS